MIMTQALMTKAKREAFFQKLSEVYPEPRCELNWTSPFTLLVAIILSAQSTDKGVNKVTSTLFPVADTPEAIADLGLERLKGYLKSINYFNNKANSIYRLSVLLRDQFGSVVPTDFETLITLPGVGRKTANVFLNVAYNAPTMGVDTHVFRLCHRLKLCTGKNPAEVEKALTKIVPEKYRKDVCLSLVLHGRYICRAGRPKCGICPLFDVCPADEKQLFITAENQKKARKSAT